MCTVVSAISLPGPMLRPGVRAAMLCLLLMPRSAGAQQLPVRTLTTADGLPRDQLACVVADDRGWLWFCTDDGLARFDGHSVTTFSAPDRTALLGLRSLLRTRDGRYFVGHGDGLAEFLPDLAPASRFRPVLRSGGESVGAVNVLLERRDGTLWAGTATGLYGLGGTPSGGRLVETDIGLPRGGENDANVLALAEDEDDQLWIGAGSGLYARSREGRTRRFTTANGLPVNEVRALVADARHRLWVATRGGLCLLDLRTAALKIRRMLTARDGLPASNVTSLLPDGDRLWVGTVMGVAELVPAADGSMVVSRAVRGFYGWGLARDAWGDLWVATESGARAVVRRGFTTFTASDGLPANRVSSLFETRDGRMCAVTLVGDVGLSCFDGRRFEPKPIGVPGALGDPGWGWSQLVLQDRRGGWWIPTGQGLLRFAPGTVESLRSARPVARFTMREGLRSDNVFRIFEDAQGGIWVATFAEPGNGLSRVEPDTGRVTTFGVDQGLPADLPLAYALADDRRGGIWIGLEHGLLRYRHGRFDVVLPAADGFTPATGQVRSLLVDREGDLWMGTTGAGLGRVGRPDSDRPAVAWFGTAQGLSNDTIWTVVEHASGDLFLGTGRGVDRFSPRTGRVVRHAADVGLPRAEILGSLQDKQGRLWFATTAGAAQLILSSDPLPAPQPTFITSVVVNGNPLPISATGERAVAPIRLQPHDARVDVSYVCPGAREADGLRYQHRVEGADGSWSAPTEQRSVTLIGPAAGQYRLLVRSVLPDATNGEPAVLPFEVLAPVWRRGWFLTLAALLAAGVAAVAYRVRLERLRAVERVRARIAADLHDDVGASLSRIAILSEVARQKIEAIAPAEAATLRAIGDNARQVVDDMSDVVWFVDPTLDDLQHVIVRIREFASELFDGGSVSFSLEAPPDAARTELTPDQRRHLYLILKESLTNVVRHAHATRVSVGIDSSRRRISAEVVDNGVGVSPGPGDASRGGGHGLANMRERAAALGGSVTITAGPGGRGTRVALDVPLRADA
jgi:signal transduction histidine kinase/ligand-binding sensor domain-containing protein